ncbi:DUF2624 family protein [Thalassorhabdus alkalitolerans]|uniref:DUF2624 family protein n=1 Tax=Thalassorhabdus alkalitolerans TaxID=2282697 RepID=A0ABW0YNS3_9BACI|nr:MULTISPECIES: DUF2624 family protein [Bacillaceae]
MNPFFQQVVKQHIAQMTPQDVMAYGQQYGVTVSREEAVKLLTLVKTEPWDFNDKQSLHAVLHKAKSNVSPATGELLEALFAQYIQ